MPYRAFHDRTGERYGRLLIIGYVGIAGHSRIWRCQCDCGNMCNVSWKQIQQNHKTSCGCRWEETRKSYGGRAGANKKALGESAFNQLFYNYQKSARERSYEFILNIEEFRELVESPCYYCGDYGDYFYTGIDRVDNTKGYVRGNVRPCCKQCNIAKGAQPESSFIDWIKRLVARFEHGEQP